MNIPKVGDSFYMDGKAVGEILDIVSHPQKNFGQSGTSSVLVKRKTFTLTINGAFNLGPKDKIHIYAFGSDSAMYEFSDMGQPEKTSDGKTTVLAYLDK